MLKDNWYQKNLKNKNIDQEAGMHENTLIALLLISVLGSTWKVINTVANQCNISTEKLVDKMKPNSPEIQEIQEIIKKQNYDQKSKDIIEKVKQEAKKIKKQQSISIPDLVKIILQHENLILKQTPFRISNEKMKQWSTIHGFEIDHLNPNYQERLKNRVQNFIFLKNPNDVYPAVLAQINKYIANPSKYQLPKNPTIKDIIYKFDQSNPSGKIKYIQEKIPNIDINSPLSSSS